MTPYNKNSFKTKKGKKNVTFSGTFSGFFSFGNIALKDIVSLEASLIFDELSEKRFHMRTSKRHRVPLAQPSGR